MNADEMIAFITSSVGSVVEALYTPLFMEGEIPDPLNFGSTENKEFELRLPEFKFQTLSKNNYRVTFPVDILIKVRISPTSPYEIKNYLGQLTTTLSSNIPIKRYGDDDSLIDCAQLISEIDVADLGQIEPKVNMVFGRVSATYKLEWSE